MKWLLLMLGGFVVLSLLFGKSDPKAQERMKARAAIQLCWKDYERRSLSEAEKQFIAGACERMEANFETKYNARP